MDSQNLKINSITIFLLFYLNIFGQSNLLITDISFVGNNSVESDSLIQNIASSTTSWLGRNIFGAEPSYYSEEFFKSDLISIVKTYQRKGFLYAKVRDVEIQKHDNKDEVSITIFIDEGNPIIVKNISVNFRNSNVEYQPVLDSLFNSIENDLILKQNKIFTDANLLSDKNMIQNLFLNNGFAHALIDYKLNIDEELSTVNINWDVNMGPKTKFGNIFFSGYERSDPEYLQSRLNFNTGEFYSGLSLQKSQQALYNLGIFNAAILKSYVGKNRTDTTIPIEIIVKEASLIRMDFGFGYGRDEKFRTSINLRILGPWGAPSRINVEAKHTALEALGLSLIYTNTDFLRLNTTFRLKTSFRRQTEPGFSAERKGIEESLLHEILPNLYSSLIFNYENVFMDSNSISPLNIVEGFKDTYDKTGMTLGLNLNKAAPIINPETGYNISILFSLTGLLKNSHYNYLTSVLEFRNFYKVHNNLTLAFRIHFGIINSYDDHDFIPIEDRYYSGGSNSIRGWGRAELGPTDENNMPIGGNSLWENNVEFRIKASHQIGFTLFLDFGNTWYRQLYYNISELRYSAGGGVRYTTPIGPIRFDAAIPIFEGKNKFQFRIS